MDACIENTREILRETGKWGFSNLEDVIHAFAHAYHDHGRSGDAAFLFNSLLDYQKQAGIHHLLKISMNLANVLRSQGLYIQAEALYTNNFTDWTSQIDFAHPDTLRALEGLAVIRSLQERFEQADFEYQQLLQIVDRPDQDSRQATLRAIEGLAYVRRHQACYDIASVLYGLALQERVEELGSRSLDIFRCVECLAIVYRHQSRLEESIHLYRQVLGDLESTLSKDHLYILRTSLNLSIAFLYRKRYAEAESTAARAYEGSKALLGPEYVDTKRCEEQLPKIRSTYQNRFVHRQYPQSPWLPYDFCPRHDTWLWSRKLAFTFTEELLASRWYL